MRQFDIVTATFQPKRIDDLRPGAKECIGIEARFQASWIIEEGQFEGQWAMAHYRPDDEPALPFVWVPFCDLVL